MSQYTWASWKRDAQAARARARRAAWFASVVATAGAIWAGLATVEGDSRYSVVVYAPLAGWVVFEPTGRTVLRSLFRTTGAAMRYRLVPALVPRASADQLAQLAAVDAVSVGSWRLRADDTGKEVIVSAGYGSGGYPDGGVPLFGEVSDSSGRADLGGDAGGGFGGGGGGDGGGG